MAQYIEADRLWPLLAYFAGAVVVIIGLDVIFDLSTAAQSTVWTIVVLWLVLTPLGAWLVWKRGANKGRG